jgi:hypothetical protein
MPRRADVNVETGIITAHWNGAGTNYIVQTPTGVLYMVFIDSLSDVSFRKSSDGGITWSQSTVIFAGTATNLAIWYDRWSNISAGLIHCVYTESATDDTLYRTINTESSDALSTQTVIFAGTSTAAGGHLSVTRAVGGNVYCKTVIDAGAEGGFYRLPNANVPNGAWDAARTVDETIATLDQMWLLPDFDAADTQDIMALFQDASVTELSRKLYDDSANTWSETSISAAITELSTATAFANVSVAPDITNTNHVVVAWNNTDSANQDLLCWTVDSGAITAKTDVVTNATDDCGLCAISIDTQTGYWWCFYGGPSTGTSTWNTAMRIYYKVSTDSGSTWGPETLLDNAPAAFTLRMLYTCPRIVKGPVVAAWVVDAQADDIKMSVEMVEPRATYVAGVV